MENIIKAVTSNSWELVSSKDHLTVEFSTMRWSYTIVKRPLFGYRLTIESIENSMREDIIFKTEDLLLNYIEEHKVDWESQLPLNQI